MQSFVQMLRGDAPRLPTGKVIKHLVLKVKEHRENHPALIDKTRSERKEEIEQRIFEALDADCTSISTIAEHSEISRTTIIRYLHEFEEREIVVIEKNKCIGGKTWKIYRK